MRLSTCILWFTFHLYPTPHKYSLFGTISFYFTAHYNNMTSLGPSTVISMIVHWSDMMLVLCFIFWMGLVIFPLEISKLSDSCQTGDPLVRMEVMCLYWYVKVREGQAVSALDVVSNPFLLYLSFVFTIWDIYCVTCLICCICLPFEIII